MQPSTMIKVFLALVASASPALAELSVRLFFFFNNALLYSYSFFVLYQDDIPSGRNYMRRWPSLRCDMERERLRCVSCSTRQLHNCSLYRWCSTAGVYYLFSILSPRLPLLHTKHLLSEMRCSIIGPAMFPWIRLLSPTPIALFRCIEPSPILYPFIGGCPPPRQIYFYFWPCTNFISQTFLQPIAYPQAINVSQIQTVQFTVDPTIGPNSAEYFIRVSSTTLSNPNSPTNPYLSFSAKFTLSGMTGTFNSTVQQQIASASATPSSTAAGTSTAVSQSGTTSRASTSTTTRANNTGAASRGAVIGVSSGSAGVLVAGAALVAGVVSLF